MGLTADGRRAYLAYLRGHFLVLDTSQLATGAIPPGTTVSFNDKLLSPVANCGRDGGPPTATARNRAPNPTRRSEYPGARSR